jgi:hypothetical protein
VAPADNPGLALGALLGESALAGRDKATFFMSPGISAFGGWVEQLIAESTGKEGKGILPVPEEQPGAPGVYGADRLFVYLRLEGDENAALDAAWEALMAGRQPGVRLALADKLDLGAEFFRWEMATAAAGAVLGINPFDQPNVALAKDKAGKLVKQFVETGSLAAPAPVLIEGELQLFGAAEGSTAATLVERLQAFLDLASPGDYVVLQAYLPPTAASGETLQRIQLGLRDQRHLAVTRGWGPRFLHSTGQLHKGDGNHGLFLQITHRPEPDLPVPGHRYDFGTLITAQAQGDFAALEENGRRVIRVHIEGDVPAGLEKIEKMLLA